MAIAVCNRGLPKENPYTKVLHDHSYAMTNCNILVTSGPILVMFGLIFNILKTAIIAMHFYVTCKTYQPPKGCPNYHSRCKYLAMDQFNTPKLLAGSNLGQFKCIDHQ